MNRILTKMLLLTLVLTSLSCSKSLKTELNPLDRKATKGLTQITAEIRKEALSNLSYFFELDLRSAKSTNLYNGTSTIVFDFIKKGFKKNILTVDFEKGLVEEVYANGKRISDFKYNGYYISIPIKHLANEKNTLKIKFSQKYSTTGSGLYKFQDPSDKRVYLYTDFEPYDANLFAPMFDQPNLKAVYSLSVVTPSDWEVISATKEQYSQVENKYKKWSFPKTQKFSTYLFSLHAGPYKVWEDRAKLKSKEIPLRLFARKSLAKNVKPDFWFKITKQGFNFFEQYFSVDYPYTKYDQVIVPDFNSGAMENVAAVTFNERNVSRDKTPLRSQRRSLANVIFHEMAHMWFGNLVTMDWWNDLWLNESFATYMAYSGLYYNTEYTESWLNFFNRTKQWAYAEDQWRTTHPIEANILSTEEASSNFDGITYGKGASSLKQLVFLIGEEKFKLGLTDYFRTYATKNTKREDFIKSLQAHTTENLTTWTKEWLQTKGLNTVTTEIVCQEQSLKEIIYTQGYASGDHILRTHKVETALWINESNLSPDEVITVKISGEKTTWSPSKKMLCPKAVFPNWNDYGFVRVILDEKSLDFITQNISSIDSKLFRSQFWLILSNMLKFGELTPQKAISLLKKEVLKEQDPDVLNSILSLLYPNYPIFELYADKTTAIHERKDLARILKTRIMNTKNIDLKKNLFRKWVYSSYEDNPGAVYKCLTKCSFNIGFSLDLDTKWFIANKLSSVRYKKNSYVTALGKLDSSRRGALSKLASKVSYSKNKAPWLAKALDDTSNLSLKERRIILKHLIPFSQRRNYFQFKQNSFFENIDQISNLPRRVQIEFVRNFTPLFCSDFSENIPVTEVQIKGSPWTYGVQKELLKRLDIDERCLKIKELSASTIKEKAV